MQGQQLAQKLETCTQNEELVAVLKFSIKTCKELKFLDSSASTTDQAKKMKKKLVTTNEILSGKN